MSYLTLENGIPNFSEAVISLWFRAPKASVIAAAASSLGDGDFKHMQGVLPLVIFGKPQTNKNYQQIITNVATGSTGPGPPPVFFTTSGYSENKAYDVDPCYVALNCSSGGTFRLAFNIQMKDSMTTKSTAYVTTNRHYVTDVEHPEPIVRGDGWLAGPSQATIVDASYIDNAQPEWFHVDGAEDLAPDVWHHVLLSFDVGGLVSIGQPHASSKCRLWYAIDDKDYRGPKNLQPFRDSEPDDGLGSNTILTSNAYRNSFELTEADHYFMNKPIPAPSGSYTPPEAEAIPAKDHPFGIPAVPKYVKGIFKAELAEFQMWTGLTLDTGVEENRRAFIDYQLDADGNIVLDEDGKQVMIPVDPKEAEELLTKKPEILLHGSGNWIDGKNTGTTGVDYDADPPEEKPEGQFVPTGEIKSYMPDPSLPKP